MILNVGLFSLKFSALHPNDWQSCQLTSFLIRFIRERAFAPIALVFLIFLSHVWIQIGCLVFTLKLLSYCFSSVQRIAPACFHAYSATVKEHFDLSFLKYLSESEHPHCAFCLHDSFAMEFFASCFNLFQLSFLFTFMSSFLFSSPPFVYIFVKLMENEYSHSWPHAVSLPPILFVCLCPIFAYFSGSVFPPGQH